MNPQKLFRFGALMRAFLLFSLLLLTARSSFAWSRAYSPMSEYVRLANVIVLVEIDPDAPKYPPRLIVREVLKGDAKIDQVIQLNRLRMGPSIPTDAATCIALFTKNEKGEAELLEAYAQPSQIEALRQVLKISRIATERERLLAWRKLLPSTNSFYAENYKWELAQMRDASNYPLLLDSFDLFDDAGKQALIQLMGNIGDPRGVPTLLEWMKNPDASPAATKFAREAAHQLTFRFPGASGVTQAFEVARKTEALKDAANSYFAERDPKFSAALRAERQNLTPYLTAQSREEAGDLRGARALWIAMIEDPASVDYTRLDSAARLAKSRARATAPDLELELRAVLPFLSRLAREGDYLQTESAARILSDLNAPKASEALLPILSRKKEEWLFRKASQIAFATLQKSDPKLRKQAAAILINRLQTAKSQKIDSFNDILLPLCWLADETDDAPIVAAAALDGNTKTDWEELAPIRRAARAKDETAELIALLQTPGSLLSNALSWIIARLSEKRDPRALPSLAAFLAKHPYQYNRETSDAILRIGGPEAEREVVELLRVPNAETQRVAVDLLVELQGEKALPLLRRMVNEKGFGSRSQAIYQMGRLGTPEDLAWLLPLSNFWTGDRDNHYWAMASITGIRSRHHYDVNGPIPN